MRGLLLSSLAVAAGCGLTLDLTPPVGDAGGGVDGGFLDGGLDAIPPDATMCETVEDCAGLERTGDPTPCGDYRCDPRGFCLENDLDGDGLGPGCEDERDCDDDMASIGSNAVIPCPGAPDGICGETATLTCTDGAWATACEGIEEAQPETCNGQDDDCNGAIDDGLGVPRPDACAPTYSCVDGAWAVSMPPTVMMEVCGDDVDDDCDGTTNDPECFMEECVLVADDDIAGSIGAVRSIQEAIATTAGDDERFICLLATTDGMGGCLPTNFPLLVDVPAGTTILGNLRYQAGGISRCARSGSTLITAPEETRPVTLRIREAGVVQLLDLAVQYGAREDSIAVSVSTARLITSNVQVVTPNAAFVPERSVGIAVGRGSELLGYRTDILPYGESSIGIDAEQALVALRSGCTDVASCACDSMGVTGISGRGDEGGAVVVREGSFNAERYALCADGAPALQLDQTTSFVAGSAIQTAGGSDAVFASCSGGEQIWLHANQIGVQGRDGDATGVSIIGECGALLTGNTIHGHSGTADTNTVVGVYCDGAECVVNHNTIVGNLGGNDTGDVYGLACSSDSGSGNCRVVTQNSIVAGGFGTRTASAIGFELLDSTGSYMEGNRISGGCGDYAVGMYARGSAVIGRANQLVGMDCATMGFSSTGLDVIDSNLSWLGNTMLGGSTELAGADCETFGAAVDNTPAIMRNNLFVGGTACSTRVAAFFDDDDVLLLFNGFTMGEPLLEYADGAFRDARSLLMAHPLFIGNVFDPDVGAGNFVDYPSNLRLRGTSPFARTGSSPGGRDIEGRPRPDPPSIGAYEP